MDVLSTRLHPKRSSAYVYYNIIGLLAIHRSHIEMYDRQLRVRDLVYARYLILYLPKRTQHSLTDPLSGLSIIDYKHDNLTRRGQWLC